MGRIESLKQIQADMDVQAAKIYQASRALTEAVERFGRELAEIERGAVDTLAQAGLPVEVEYDRTRLNEPPRPIQPEQNGAPKCNCGLTAEFKKSAPQNPKQWAAWFCARPKNDPKNCGFRKWID